jgi:hypothetical protein
MEGRIGKKKRRKEKRKEGRKEGCKEGRKEGRKVKGRAEKRSRQNILHDHPKHPSIISRVTKISHTNSSETPG